jgi:hypothetical protein
MGEKLDKPASRACSCLELIGCGQGCRLENIRQRDAKNVGRWTVFCCRSLTRFTTSEGTKSLPLGGTRQRREERCFISLGGSFWFAPKSRPRSLLSPPSGLRRKRNSGSSTGRPTISPFFGGPSLTFSQLRTPRFPCVSPMRAWPEVDADVV